MDRLHSMRVFARVVDEGSLAAAARALDLSPAVVTRLLADLEEHLGARLINRTTRRLSLTDAGEAYLESVRQILTAIDEAEALAGASTALPRGHLKVLCPPAFAVHQLAKHLPRFRARCPQLTIELSVPGLFDTLDESHDVNILIEGARALDGNYLARRLARAELIVCASPDYLDRHGRPDHPQDLKHHETLIPGYLRELDFHTVRWSVHAGPPQARTPERGARGIFDAPGGESVRVSPMRQALSTMHTDTMYAAALAGMGITGLPSFVAEDALMESALERVLPHWHLLDATLYAAIPTRKHVPARTRAFVDFLVETFGGEDRDPWLSAVPAAPPDRSRPARVRRPAARR